MSVERSGALSPNNSVVRQGYLRKLKTMKKKYFVLKAETAESSARLEYYDSEKKFKTNAPPKRVISIKSCFNINRRLDTKHKHVIAFYIKEECFCVVLDGEEELSSWLNSLLVLYHGDVGSEELPHPRQHVWQVNIQKKGLGGAKNILGLYHLCLTDKTVSLVKIKANSAVLPSDHFSTRPIEFPLMSIRRCGDTECFFYMEIGRSAETGAGELWMHTDDANIAQSMHATILQAMTASGKDELWPTIRGRSSSANEASKPLTALARRQTLSGAKPGLSPSNERGSCSGGICVMLCIGPCATASATCSIERETAPAPTSPQPASVNNQSWNNTTLIHSIDTINNAVANTRRGAGGARGGEGAAAGHQRTASLPFSFAKPELAVSHERTRSLPLAGDEVRPAEAKAPKGAQPWLGRRASTGCRLAKRSPAHVKNGENVRERCDSLPSRCRVATEATSLARPFSVCTGLARGISRSPPNSDHQLNERCSSSTSVDEVDGVEWAHRTPRSIPEEEPDTSAYVPMDSSLPKNTRVEKHSRTPSLAEDYLPMAPGGDAGYVPMERARDSPLSPALSSCSVTSGTPSTDMRFSEFHLDRAKCYFAPPDEDEARPVRAYSVGSRPAFRPHPVPTAAADSARARAFSVGSRSRGPRPLAPPLAAPHAPPAASHKSSSAPLLAAGHTARSATVEPLHDLMELDFSNRVSSSPKSARNHSSHSSSPGSRQLTLPLAARTPRPVADGYVDMSPRSSGYVEMKPAEPGLGSAPLAVPRTRRASLARSPPAERPPSAPDGYVEMSYGSADRNRTASRPITIHANNLKNRKESGSVLPLSGARSPSTDSGTLTPPKSSPVRSPQTPTVPHVLANGRRAARKHVTRRNSKEPSTPGSQTIFPFSLNSPGSPIKPFTVETPEATAPTAEPEREDFDDTDDALDSPSQYMELTPSGLSTVREISEPTHGTRISFENQKSIKQMLNAAKATGKISEIQLSDYVTLKPGSTLPFSGRRSGVSRQNSNSSSGGGENDYTIMEPISAKGRSTHTSAPINARTRMAARKEDATHAKENRGNGALLSTNPMAHKSLTAEAPPKAASTAGTRKPILVTISGQVAPAAASFKPGGETPALHYAALQLEQSERSPRPAAPPCPAFTYSQIDFVKSEELSAADKN